MDFYYATNDGFKSMEKDFMIKVMPVVGVRPQIIKASPIISLLGRNPEIEIQLVHSGQHYDFELSKTFFNELDLPDPAFNLDVGSGSHANQTARTMTRLETVLKKLKPDVVMVFGDGNTTLGATLAAVKSHIPVCHVESGARTYDMSEPEEVNRVLVDHASQLLCAPTWVCSENLRHEGLGEVAFLSGDTMLDAFLSHSQDIEESAVAKNLHLNGEVYAVLTLHRAENVDSDRLEKIISAVVDLDIRVVFPVHPRTLTRLRRAGLWRVLLKAPNMLLAKPVSYFDMLSLMKHSHAILTDSGGVQKEAFFLQVPCVTLLYHTGSPETVWFGANKLVGAEPDLIVKAVEEADAGALRTKLQNQPNPFGDGKASERIIAEMKDRFQLGKLQIKPKTTST
jgi:UDP-N-acetylglucosamine 2-epimerase (non-hydrolysing)